MAAGWPPADVALADRIRSEITRHGGVVEASQLYTAKPELRKQLGDRKLLRFLRDFPTIFNIQEDKRRGHLLRLHECDGLPAAVSAALPDGSYNEEPKVATGRAAHGATLPATAAASLSAGQLERVTLALKEDVQGVCEKRQHGDSPW
eukprot:TRINITY_DN93770_c0_g1_i1.p1 TRINITY_DN93770_c0_g1~~TRINITY_DN93770_c0_g1_i1.p1  ORF type:complete len:148 (+),score=37.45 TRINITY_DN93770_c0_g1_i1:71-514(+)